MNMLDQISQLDQEGYAILPAVYSDTEVNQIGQLLSDKEPKGSSVLKSTQLYAIRQLLIEVPELWPLLLNDKLRSILSVLQSDSSFFLSKAIYFDKPADSNWFVAYHQDLTINVEENNEVDGFKNWTNKRGQIGVQPPVEYLNSTVTVRVHLDDTDEKNGALRVVPRSHSKGIIRQETTGPRQNEVSCSLKRGDVMLMKPLTLHASSRSFGTSNRRVIHLEFCDMELPKPLRWKEKHLVFTS